jgi:phosphatidylserine/phosphatidylglycerophosphate/cardiolipin synthase-like enzyme
MSKDFQITGQNAAALFTLKVYRGDGMALLAMNWKNGKPPDSFVGFGIEYKQPGGDRFYPLKNRLGFPTPQGGVDPNRLSTLRSPIQKFRWVHFPSDASLQGEFTYRVAPVFMNEHDELSYGDTQEVKIELGGDTYLGKLNVAYTRGFISSQAFVDRYKTVSSLLPAKAKDGLRFVERSDSAEALSWMGFEARGAILKVLDEAIADTQAQVRVVAYDLNEPRIVQKLEQLGSRLKIIIDDEGDHGQTGSAESQAEQRLSVSAGRENVRRQHMGNLQHNKTIVVDGLNAQRVVCGSTNFSWRGLYVQANNAVVLYGKEAVRLFQSAFDNYWNNSSAGAFATTVSAAWAGLGLSDIDARVTFSPHSQSNAVLQAIADEIDHETTSTLLYSLAFLYQTPGPIRDAITKVTKRNDRFVYGISDRKLGGLNLQKPSGNVAPVYPAALTKNLPEPFKSEPTGGGGIRMHHKFVVIDFDQPTARVYLGSFNFSGAADMQNGENLLLIRDRRVAVSYAVEALSLFDHYHFRVKEEEAKRKKKGSKKLTLAKPPRKPKEKAWWVEYYTDPQKIRDRELFA